MMSQWASLATSLPIVMSKWVMEQKQIVLGMIYTKNSAQNGISTGDLGMEILFKTGHSIA